MKVKFQPSFRLSVWFKKYLCVSAFVSKHLVGMLPSGRIVYLSVLAGENGEGTRTPEERFKPLHLSLFCFLRRCSQPSSVSLSRSYCVFSPLLSALSRFRRYHQPGSYQRRKMTFLWERRVERTQRRGEVNRYKMIRENKLQAFEKQKLVFRFFTRRLI